MSYFIQTKVTLTSGEQATVYYLTEQGKKLLEGLLASDNYTQKRFETVFERLNELQDELVRTLFLDHMKIAILEELKVKPNQTQRDIAQKLLPSDFTKNKLVHHAFSDAWQLLEKNYVIVAESHGKGHPRTWKISIQEEKVKS